MSTSARSLLLPLLLGAVLQAPAAAAFDKIIVFGDSLSDIGASPSAVKSAYKLLGNNCSADFPCPPYFDGRISNGPVAVERLADLAGLNTVAGLQGHAIGGAMTNNSNFADPGAPGMKQQVDDYLAAGPADPNALYVIWGGANDFSNAVALGNLSSATATTAVANLSNYVSSLIGAGARQFLVPNLPNLSLTPSAHSAATFADLLSPGSGAALLAGLTALTHNFNEGLLKEMQRIDGASPAIIKLYPIDELVDQVVANPASFGLSNVTTGCLSGFDPCVNPEAFLFWDDSHPTTQAHRILGDAFFAAAVPEAQTWVMLLLALPLVWSVSRFRRTRPEAAHA